MAPPTPPGSDETPFDSDESDKLPVLATFEESHTNLPDFYCELFIGKNKRRKDALDVGDYYAIDMRML